MSVFLLFFLGLALLIFGSHLLIRSTMALSFYLKVKPLFLSIVLLGFATSLGEWFVTVAASLKGVSDVALGNILGSNIINVLLILGLTGLFYAHPADRQIKTFDLPLLLLSFLILGALSSFDFLLGSLDSLFLLGFFLFYLFLLFKKRKESGEKEKELSPPSLSLFVSLRDLVFGFAGLFIGSSLAVDSALELGKMFGLSERFIGLFVLSFGTSLPELATSLQAVFKRQREIALGNIIGSNMFNTLFVLGSAGLVRPLIVARDFYFDYFFMFGVTALLWGSLFLFKGIPRMVSFLFLLTYGFYITFVSLS